MAAALVVGYIMAYQMLHRIAKVKNGGRILIHSAAGGVGTAMLQLANLDDVTVYGTASKPKHDLVRELGGIPIDYKNEDFVERIAELTGGNGVDAAFDPMGATHLWRSYKTVQRGRKLVVYGFQVATSGSRFDMWLTFPMVLLTKLLPGKSTAVYSLRATREGYREDMAKLLSLLSFCEINPIIAETMPLSEAARAH